MVAQSKWRRLRRRRRNETIVGKISRKIFFRLSWIETTTMTFNGQKISQFAKNVAWAGRKRNQYLLWTIYYLEQLRFALIDRFSFLKFKLPLDLEEVFYWIQCVVIQKELKGCLVMLQFLVCWSVCLFFFVIHVRTCNLKCIFYLRDQISPMYW